MLRGGMFRCDRHTAERGGAGQHTGTARTIEKGELRGKERFGIKE